MGRPMGKVQQVSELAQMQCQVYKLHSTKLVTGREPRKVAAFLDGIA